MHDYLDNQIERCRNGWWLNVLFINNWFSLDKIVGYFHFTGCITGVSGPLTDHFLTFFRLHSASFIPGTFRPIFKCTLAHC